MKTAAVTAAFLSLATITAANPVLHYRNDTSSTALQWGDCKGFNTTLKIECSTLDVPLDYTDPASDKKHTLQLVKVLAEKASKGSILTNFGGPGFEARHTLIDFGERLLNVSGGEYNIIAFDPRGTGPDDRFSCFDDDVERALVNARNPMKITEDDGHGQLWAESGVFANACGNNTKAQEMGPYIGTAFVARDLMQVVDALGEDGKLRYYGASYGTTLGATVAAMFPDRMDKVVLDAVVNSNRYYHNSGIDVDQLLSADAAWMNFMEECSTAGFPACPLADLGSTPVEIANTLRVAAESYISSPVTVGTFVVDYNIVVNTYYFAIRSMSIKGLETYGPLLKSIATRSNLEPVVEHYQVLAASLLGEASEPIWGIRCGDQFPRHKTLDAEAMVDYDLYTTSSKMFGGISWSFVGVCDQWQIEAKEKYAGGFTGIKTAKPVLFVQNTYDAATSVSAAKNMTTGFEGSVLFEQVGYGHGSFAQKSSCSMDRIRDYFVNEKLPEPGTKCAIDKSEELFA